MKTKSITAIFLLLFICKCTMPSVGHYVKQDKTEQFHNVIVLIPDGCGIAHMTIARWFKGAPLVQDSMRVSLVHTFCANSMITGSAAAATAFVTGFKTWEGDEKARCLSMLPDSLLIPKPQELPTSQQWRPIATVLEGAHLQGKAVGLVATCRVSHATPAAYASHWHARTDENIIMEQLVYQNLDVVFGGGSRYLVADDNEIPGSSSKGRRQDGENLYEALASNGYKIITTKEELNALSKNTQKVWGMFAESHMLHDIDRHRFAPDEPSIAEMTEKAIEILGKNPNGFFLMVEGSQVDWSSHGNDPVGTITEYIAFDQAVRIALDFARSNPDQPTLILIFPDHDNGGMSLGHYGGGYSAFKPCDMVDIIKNASLTADAVAYLIYTNLEDSEPDSATIHNIIAENYGIDDITAHEIDTIITDLRDTLNYNLTRIIGHILSDRAGIGWTTFEHTGHDVPMFSFGLDHPPQTIDNTDIARLCARALGFDLTVLNERLIVDASTLFKNAKITIDASGVETSKGMLLVDNGKTQAIFPFFKNMIIIEQDTLILEGLTLYSQKANKVFLPRQAKKLFDKH
ncbi:MAG: alkaline phosphatase [bacterium]